LGRFLTNSSGHPGRFPDFSTIKQKKKKSLRFCFDSASAKKEYSALRFFPGKK
jgi:hypothetical protein